MSKLGFLVLCLVGAGVVLFALSVVSSPRVPEWAEPAVSQGGSRHDTSAAGAGRVGLGGRPRRGADAAPASVPRGHVGRKFDRRSGSGEKETQGLTGADVTGAGGTQGAASVPGQSAMESLGGRRDHLRDFLARDARDGGPGGDRGVTKGESTVGGWEVAGAEGKGDGALELAGAEAAGEDANTDDVSLSVPLDGSAEADGAIQPFVEEGLKVDEETGTVEFLEDSVLGFPDAGSIIRPEAGTRSLEIEPNWDGTDGRDNSFVQVKTPGMWQGALSLLRNGPYLVFRFVDEQQRDHNIGVEISRWKQGEAHSVTATWGDALMSLYIDGQLAGQGTYSGDPSFAENMPLFLGSNPRNHVPGAGSRLRNFKVYNRALSPDEIVGGGPISGRDPDVGS